MIEPVYELSVASLQLEAMLKEQWDVYGAVLGLKPITSALSDRDS